MPPAFNLSQDQTLQFDLEFKVLRPTHKNGIEVNFTSILMSVWFGNSPSNAHAYRLYLVKDALKINFFKFRSLRSANPCIIAPFFDACKKNLKFSFCVADCVLRSAKSALYISFWVLQKFLQRTFQELAARSRSALARVRTIAPFCSCFGKKLFSRSHQDGFDWGSAQRRLG